MGAIVAVHGKDVEMSGCLCGDILNMGQEGWLYWLEVLKVRMRRKLRVNHTFPSSFS